MTYPRPGDSDEVKNLIGIALSVPGARVTCTTDHGIFTGAGFISYHRRGGTNGNGLAIDVGGSPEVMKQVFKLFEGYRNQLHELIHTPMGYSYKDGNKTSPIDAAHHYNHVHISIKKGIQLHLTTQGVKPMFDPPIEIAAWCIFHSSAINAQAVAAVTPNGAVFCEPPEAYQGGAPQSAFQGRKAAQIVDNGQGGYQITATSGEKYSLPEGTHPV